jgi:hypothetical protein
MNRVGLLYLHESRSVSRNVRAVDSIHSVMVPRISEIGTVTAGVDCHPVSRVSRVQMTRLTGLECTMLLALKDLGPRIRSRLIRFPRSHDG